MASPQVENGYTLIANELLEQMYSRKFSASQIKILLLVIRFTYGFNRKSASLSNSFVSAGTGLHEVTVSKEVSALIQDNVLKIYKKQTYNAPRSIGVNKDYEGWRNHLLLADALSLSQNSYSVSETVNLEGVKSLPKKYKSKKYKHKEIQRKALTGEIGEAKYDEQGRKLNEAGYPIIDFGLGKSGIDF